MMPDDLYSPVSSLPLLLKSRSRTLNCAYSARHTMSMAAGSAICLTISSGERSFVTRAFHRSSCICVMNLSAPSRFAICFTSGGAAASGAASTVAPAPCSGCAGSGISIAAPASKPGGACAWKLPKPATCTTNGEPGASASGTTTRTVFGPSPPSGCETSTPSTGCRSVGFATTTPPSTPAPVGGESTTTAPPTISTSDGPTRREVRVLAASRGSQANAVYHRANRQQMESATKTTQHCHVWPS